ncbi:aminotransferase class I/II-fold pyridoxal phosphate-dependent enzyme [Kitasatospora saccharophila]|uniref:aminotransferase class I/II-fold pyridoxal phosphate-dependent enzyme n=1 Tax=Kitasatospora saccharophila TaxID=407973 RepID=UPI00363D2BB9
MFERFSRAGTGSAKWARAGAGRIAMGVADMDLPGPPAVGAALRVRAGHPAFGYPVAEDADRVLVADWYRRRHGVEVDPRWVMLLPFAPGTAVRLLLEAVRPLPGPAVCVTPEWGGFARVCRAAGVELRELPLLPTGDPADPYRLPLAGVAASRPGLVMLSSPHNPTGRIWSAADVRALAAAAAPGLLVSDEVHGDLRHPDAEVPQPVAVAVTGGAANVVTLGSVGKTFNVSGLPSCFALVPDAGLRERLTAAMAGFGLWEGACWARSRSGRRWRRAARGWTPCWPTWCGPGSWRWPRWAVRCWPVRRLRTCCGWTARGSAPGPSCSPAVTSSWRTDPISDRPVPAACG